MSDDNEYRIYWSDSDAASGDSDSDDNHTGTLESAVEHLFVTGDLQPKAAFDIARLEPWLWLQPLSDVRHKKSRN